MASGRPIIAFAEDQAKHVIEENKLGFSCYPEKPGELAQIILNILELPINVLDDMERAKTNS